MAARSLSGPRAPSVGLVIARPSDTLGVEPFFMRFIAGLEGQLSRQNIALLLQFVDDHRAAIDAMRLCWAEKRVDGVVIVDLWTDDTRIAVLDNLGIPAVLVGRQRHDTALPAVWTDDPAAVTMGVDDLVAVRALVRTAPPATATVATIAMVGRYRRRGGRIWTLPGRCRVA